MVSILGQNITRLRENLGMTQSVLADLSGVSAATINKIENGNRNTLSSDSIIKIANALEVTTDELLKNEDYRIEEFETTDIEEALNFFIQDKDLKYKDDYLSDIEKELLMNAINNAFSNIDLLRKNK